jgi:hypothetical protein
MFVCVVTVFVTFLSRDATPLYALCSCEWCYLPCHPVQVNCYLVLNVNVRMHVPLGRTQGSGGLSGIESALGMSWRQPLGSVAMPQVVEPHVGQACSSN